MSLAMLEELLLQSERFRVRPKIGLAATEPLIHPEILAFCEAIVQKGFCCQITTNRSSLPRLASSLVDIGVDELIISCDGARCCGLTSRSASERRTRGFGRLPETSDRKPAGPLQHEQL